MRKGDRNNHEDCWSFIGRDVPALPHVKTEKFDAATRRLDAALHCNNTRLIGGSQLLEFHANRKVGAEAGNQPKVDQLEPASVTT